MTSKTAKRDRSTPYSKMARYYDAIYSQLVDYRSNADYLEKILARHKKGRQESILDCACGTGNYTFILAEDGYKTTGIDISKEMVQLAREKSVSKTAPHFLRMDMRQIELGERYDIATVLFGGFGYLRERGDAAGFFAGVKRSLRPDGLLVFEFWQDTAINPAASRPSGHSTFVRVRDGNRLMIRFETGRYDAQTNILSIEFEFYVLDTEKRTVPDTFSETHLVKTYAISHMRELLERSGFNALAFYDGDLGGTKKDEPKLASFSTFRVLAVARPTA